MRRAEGTEGTEEIQLRPLLPTEDGGLVPLGRGRPRTHKRHLIIGRL